MHSPGSGNIGSKLSRYFADGPAVELGAWVAESNRSPIGQGFTDEQVATVRDFISKLPERITEEGVRRSQPQ